MPLAAVEDAAFYTVRVCSMRFHNVDLAATGPGTVLEVFRKHEHFTFQPVPTCCFDPSLDLSIAQAKVAKSIKSGRSVIVYNIVLFPGSDDKFAVFNETIVISVCVILFLM